MLHGQDGEKMRRKHVKGSTTSLNGCKVEIDGDLVYTLVPLRVTGFEGVVHITGKPGLPNGDMYFGIEPKEGVPPVCSVDE
jgi:hypothetical protein